MCVASRYNGQRHVGMLRPWKFYMSYIKYIKIPRDCHTTNGNISSSPALLLYRMEIQSALIYTPITLSMRYSQK